MRLEFTSLPERLQLVRSAIRQAAGDVGFEAEKCDALVLAVNEACANVMQHAYAGRQDGWVVLEIYRIEDGLELVLQDWGHSVTADQLRSRPLDQIRPGGLGVHFMQSLLDAMEYQPSAEAGNRMVMRIDKH